MFSTLAIITPGRDNGILVGSASRPTLESNSASSSGFSFISTNFFNHSIDMIMKTALRILDHHYKKA